MSLLWIWLIIFVLYFRTLKYNYVIDDNVKREGYMYEVPLTSAPKGFTETRPSEWYRVFMIGMHCVNVSVIYLLWGWCPALLFAVHPMCVWGVAWVTGNYYATATYFTLIAYYIIHTFPNIWGALAAMSLYAAALNSTVCPITFPFLFLFIGEPWGLTMFIPLIIYFNGKKFKTGIKIRYEIRNNRVVRDGLVKENIFRRFAVMVKVIARYTFEAIYPNRIGFFSGFGSNVMTDPKVWNLFHSFNKSFWMAFSLCLTVFVAGLLINPFGALWFFVFIALHSQFNLTGQFHAQRYLYLALVGMCIVVGTLLQPHPIAVAVVAAILFIRSHIYVPTWRNMGAVWINDYETFPESPQVYNNFAQHFLSQENTPPYILNFSAYLLFKSEAMDPKAWETQMNIACFFAKLNQLDACLERTILTMALLKPLGGLQYPMEVLTKQKDDLEKAVAELKNPTKKEDSNAPASEQGVGSQVLPI